MGSGQNTEKKLITFENKVPRKIFGSTRENVAWSNKGSIFLAPDTEARN